VGHGMSDSCASMGEQKSSENWVAITVNVKCSREYTPVASKAAIAAGLADVDYEAKACPEIGVFAAASDMRPCRLRPALCAGGTSRPQ
jgi:hypothetical protein